ncbi:methyltransferase domain-containing protein [Sphingobium sp. CR2-8]|uniref:methyltransferase domain-containing protein n=1 Tax=Sphingobium sp. CR2-8 TaxID=1306534 RepID=UPI002DBCAA06|nr:methyltransferase domain-containing protein [Sphingobium sp. CR2-8]MEC3910852.1 methyltransferase domain-containing protein [Sphingobium sp. CR2-8]
MIDLSRPVMAQEQMDAPDLPPETYAAVLHDLSRVNKWTMAARPTLGFLGRIARPGEPLRILDVGYGAGDMLRTIAQWGRTRRIPLTLVGIDLNPRSAAVAKAATAQDMEIDYRTGDYADLANQNWDVILSSLVAHHMSREELIQFLRFMDGEASRGWLINDLHRHRFAYLGYPLLARLMQWHPIVRQDGTLSIARSYRRDEWRPLLDEAAIMGARVFRAFPFRLCVERCR